MRALKRSRSSFPSKNSNLVDELPALERQQVKDPFVFHTFPRVVNPSVFLVGSTVRWIFKRTGSTCPEFLDHSSACKTFLRVLARIDDIFVKLSVSVVVPAVAGLLMLWRRCMLCMRQFKVGAYFLTPRDVLFNQEVSVIYLSVICWTSCFHPVDDVMHSCKDNFLPHCGIFMFNQEKEISQNLKKIMEDCDYNDK